MVAHDGAVNLPGLDLRADAQLALLRELPTGIQGDADLRDALLSAIRPSRIAKVGDDSHDVGLAAGDVALVDTSHVITSGGDVNHVYLDVLPALVDGVWVCLSGMYWPFEYPPEVPQTWDEAYLVRAWLSMGSAYRIELFPDYLVSCHPGSLAGRFSTLWLRKLPA